MWVIKGDIRTRLSKKVLKRRKDRKGTQAGNKKSGRKSGGPAGKQQEVISPEKIEGERGNARRVQKTFKDV